MIEAAPDRRRLGAGRRRPARAPSAVGPRCRLPGLEWSQDVCAVRRRSARRAPATFATGGGGAVYQVPEKRPVRSPRRCVTLWFCEAAWNGPRARLMRMKSPFTATDGPARADEPSGPHAREPQLDISRPVSVLTLLHPLVQSRSLPTPSASSPMADHVRQVPRCHRRFRFPCRLHDPGRVHVGA